MAEFDLQSELQNVFDAANRSNTAIYAVDPRGLSTGEFDIQDNIGSRQSQDALRSTMATLQVLAENTDGRAIVNRNDLAKGMEQIVRDSSAYYLVGYNSTQAPQDGKFHPIRVRIKRPGVQVRARKGYWALSADETVRATAPAKAGPPPAVTRGHCWHHAGEQPPVRPDLDGHRARPGRPHEGDVRVGADSSSARHEARGGAPGVARSRFTRRRRILQRAGRRRARRVRRERQSPST